MVLRVVIFGLFVVILWLGFLTFSLRKLRSNYITLTQGVNRKTLDVVLSNVVKEIRVTKEDIANLIARCDRIEKEERFHIQKIGLLRFNPFKDTGGDQSFILALVDAHDTGIVITALYSRSGTRWYTKKVLKGRGIEHELSDEEKKALKSAQISNV